MAFMAGDCQLVVGGAVLVDAANGHRDVMIYSRTLRDGHRGGWQFPSFVVEKGDKPRQALAEELQQEFGIAVEESEFEQLSFTTTEPSDTGAPGTVLLLYAIAPGTHLPCLVPPMRAHCSRLPQLLGRAR